MKYIKTVLIVTLVITLLSGCSSDGIKLVSEDGQFYLVLSNLAGIEQTQSQSEEAPAIKFASIEEMLNDISTGTFTTEEKEQLVRFKQDEQGRTILFDLDKVWEPVYPSNYDEISVIWNGSSYSFTGVDSTISKLWDPFIIISKEYYAEQTEKIKNWDQYKTCNSVTTEERDGIEVTVYDYNARNELEPDYYRKCVYTLSDDSKELLISETYDPDIDLQTPTSINIYGKSGEAYFNVYVMAFTNRPSPEWLLSFDIKPYAGQKVKAT